MAYVCLGQAFFMNVNYLMIFFVFGLSIIFLKYAPFMENDLLLIYTYLKVYCILMGLFMLISAIHLLHLYPNKQMIF